MEERQSWPGAFRGGWRSVTTPSTAGGKERRSGPGADAKQADAKQAEGKFREQMDQDREV